jgi:hypothetical protein
MGWWIVIILGTVFVAFFGVRDKKNRKAKRKVGDVYVVSDSESKTVRRCMVKFHCINPKCRKSVTIYSQVVGKSTMCNKCGKWYQLNAHGEHFSSLKHWVGVMQLEHVPLEGVEISVDIEIIE